MTHEPGICHVASLPWTMEFTLIIPHVSRFTSPVTLLTCYSNVGGNHGFGKCDIFQIVYKKHI